MLNLQYPTKWLLQELQLTLTVAEHELPQLQSLQIKITWKKNIFKEQRRSTGLKEQIIVIILLFLIAPPSG